MSEKSTARRATIALTATLVLLAGGVAAFVLLSQPGGPLAPARSQSAGSDTASQSASSGSAATSTSAAPATPATTTADPLGNGRLAKMIAAGDIRSIRLIGDSITAGWLCDGFGEYPDTDVVIYSGPQGTYNETSPQVACWANDFRAWATAHGVTSFVNAGIPGFRMEYLAQAPDAWLADGADLTVVMLGTNDACHCSVDEFRALWTRSPRRSRPSAWSRAARASPSSTRSRSVLPTSTRIRCTPRRPAPISSGRRSSPSSSSSRVCRKGAPSAARVLYPRTFKHHTLVSVPSRNRLVDP